MRETGIKITGKSAAFLFLMMFEGLALNSYWLVSWLFSL